MHITETQISNRVVELSKQIEKDYSGKEIFIMPILTGSFIFAADLVRCINLPMNIEFIRTRRKDNGKVVVDMLADFVHLNDKHILLVEDVVNTGETISEVYKAVEKFYPSDIQIVTLLLKPEKFRGHRPAYVGFEIEDKFVHGYGLDKDQKQRNCSFITAIPKNMSVAPKV